MPDSGWLKNRRYARNSFVLWYWVTTKSKTRFARLHATSAPQYAHRASKLSSASQDMDISVH